ncbi:MAG: penicillin-binding protein activator [Acetobacterales bacterium]
MSHRKTPFRHFPRLAPALLALTLFGCETAGLGDPGSASSQPATASPAQTAPPPQSSSSSPLEPVAPPAAEPLPSGRLQLIPPPGYREQVRVGLLLPMSGPDAATGQALFNAAQLALFDLDNDSLVLLPRDTRGTAEGARAAVESVLFEGADLILGPFFSAAVAAVAPRAREAKVDVVAFSTDRNVAQPGVYVMGFLPGDQVRRVLDYAAGRGLRRFAVMAPDNEYGHRVAQHLQSDLREGRGTVTQVEFYGPEAGPEQLSDPVRRLANYEARKAALQAQKQALRQRSDEVARRALARLEGLDTIGEVNFDAVMIPDGGERLRAVASLFPYYDIGPPSVRLLGTGLWDSPDLGAEPALVGGWFAAPDPGPRREFFTRYRDVYGSDPPPLATLAYDAAALAGVLAQGATDGVLKSDEITSPNGFWGIDGIFRFRPDGTVDRGLAVMEMTPEGPKVISPAPETFQAPVN